MRNMSFKITTDQFRDRSKRVTRRLGWWDLKPGERLQGIEKGQGLKKGEKVVKLGVILVESAEQERLDRMITEPEYGRAECILEGFPEYTPEQFVAMFCAANGCAEDVQVNRIAYDYVDVPGSTHVAKTVINPAASWPFPSGRRP